MPEVVLSVRRCPPGGFQAKASRPAVSDRRAGRRRDWPKPRRAFFSRVRWMRSVRCCRKPSRTTGAMLDRLAPTSGHFLQPCAYQDRFLRFRCRPSDLGHAHGLAPSYRRKVEKRLPQPLGLAGNTFPGRRWKTASPCKKKPQSRPDAAARGAERHFLFVQNGTNAFRAMYETDETGPERVCVRRRKNRPPPLNAGRFARRSAPDFGDWRAAIRAARRFSFRKRQVRRPGKIGIIRGVSGTVRAR